MFVQKQTLSGGLSVALSNGLGKCNGNMHGTSCVISGEGVKNMSNTKENEDYLIFPPYIIWGVFIVSVMPFVLNFFGISFGSEAIPLTVEKVNRDGIVADDLFYALRGASHHALLEWSAVMVAFFTILLSFAYYKIVRDVTAPIIGIALFCSSMMDAFHTFAALRLIDASAPNIDLIPFTWALSRTFNAIILIVGAFLVMSFKKERTTFLPIIMTSIIFGLVSYILIHLAATSPNLPKTQYPEAFITRPFDVLPLVLFLFAVPIFMRLYKRKRNFLVAAMILALVPEVVLEAHMAFGSSHLFDNNFNIAHALKIFSYLVPFVGLLFDYVHSYKLQHDTQILLEKREEHLAEANAELEEFAYRTSHDLRSPIVSSIGVLSITERAIQDQDHDKALLSLSHAQDSLKILEVLIGDILTLTEVKYKEEESQAIDIAALTEEGLKKLAHMDEFGRLDIQKDFQFEGNLLVSQMRFSMILENLISNAIKYQDPKKENPYVHIRTWEEKKFFVLEVKDNGLGIPKDQQDKIFTMFARFHPQTSFGSGLGLYLMKKSADILDGEISFQDHSEGSIFQLRIPL